MPVTKIFKSTQDELNSFIVSYFEHLNVAHVYVTGYKKESITITLDSDDLTELISELKYIKEKLDNQ